MVTNGNTALQEHILPYYERYSLALERIVEDQLARLEPLEITYYDPIIFNEFIIPLIHFERIHLRTRISPHTIARADIFWIDLERAHAQKS